MCCLYGGINGVVVGVGDFVGVLCHWVVVLGVLVVSCVGGFVAVVDNIDHVAGIQVVGGTMPTKARMPTKCRMPTT